MTLETHIAHLEAIIDTAARAETLLAIVARAWADLDFDDRREVGERWPGLADALVRVEGR